ncbi:MAG: hypothetical protein GY804_13790 [Alphaproteobacteria bacterium]|nr:hypothetical protein [Alphaproteobacteria bacterium]
MPNDNTCKQLLLAGWDQKLGYNIMVLGVWNAKDGVINANFGYNGFYSHDFPVTVSEAADACVDGAALLFFVN